MKRVKVSKRPAAQAYTLKPNRLRMFLVYLIAFSLALLIGFGVRWLFNGGKFDIAWVQEQTPLFVLILLGGSLVMSFTEYSRWTISVVRGDRVEGPSGMFGDRLTIPLNQIDWTRTRRSLSSWLKLGNGIYNHARQRILVSPWFFSPAKFRELLNLMGDEEVNAG